MKEFYNEELKAYNVQEVNLDLDILDEIRLFFEEDILNNLNSEPQQTLGDPDGEDHFFKTYTRWSSDLKWVSVNNLKTYQRWLEYFHKFSLDKTFSNLVDFDERIVVYSIFFVARSKCFKYNFHDDFVKGVGVNALSLMAPLHDMESKDSIHLSYRNKNDETATYKYKKGKAIVFGEKFIHGTDIGQTKEQEVFLCFSFGTDKEEYLEKIFKTTANQGEYFMHPTKGFIRSHQSPSYRYFDLERARDRA